MALTMNLYNYLTKNKPTREHNVTLHHFLPTTLRYIKERRKTMRSEAASSHRATSNPQSTIRSSFHFHFIFILFYIILYFILFHFFKEFIYSWVYNIVYSKNRATNLNQLFTEIQYLQFQLITDIKITIISIPWFDLTFERGFRLTRLSSDDQFSWLS